MNTIMVIERASLAKVLVAGATTVGKTSLVNSWVFEGFTDVTPTIGVNFAQKICYGKAGPLNLSIWDLSGHERFRCLMPRFCQGATGVALVFDVTTPESLEAAGHWLEFISSWNTAQENLAIVLVGNKTDLQPLIPHNTIQTFCTRHHISQYVTCSAKTGKNVRLVFSTLCSAIQRDQLRFSQAPLRLVESNVSYSSAIKG
jgi:small GTP-binding protein